jgi:flagella basal body P-ring formation protein FlgA
MVNGHISRIAATFALLNTVVLATAFGQETEADLRLIAVNTPQSVLPVPEVLIPVIDLSILEISIPSGSDEQATQAAPALEPTAQTLESELLRQLRIQLPAGGEDIEVERINFHQDITLPAEPWNVDFSFRMPQRGIGNVSFTGAVMGPDQKVQKVTGTLSIDRIAMGVQATRIIRRGEPIGEGDLKRVQARLSQLPPDALPRTDFLVGTEARNEIRPGVFLTGRMLELPTLIKSRQAVTMRLDNGPIQIVAKGIAKQNGSLGDVIRIENPSSKREVLARVIASDTVEVIY